MARRVAGAIGLAGALLAIVAVPATTASRSTPPTQRFLIGAARIPGDTLIVEILGPAGQLERVVDGQAGLSRSGPAWSPSGSMLAWVARRGLSVEQANGSGRHLLVRKPAACPYDCLTFDWAPDGTRLVVGDSGVDRPGGEKSRLLVVSAERGRSVEIAPAGRRTQYSALGWSPDGRSIVFARYQSGATPSECCRLDLLVVGADGKHSRRLLAFHDAINTGVFASWSPDSRSIAFTASGSKDPNDPSFGVIDVATGRLRVIRGIESTEPPTWSPDSRRLAVGALAGLVTLSPSGGAVRLLARGAGMATWARRGGVFFVEGKDVVQSRDGRPPGRALFRLPKSLGIMTLDPG